MQDHRKPGRTKNALLQVVLALMALSIMGCTSSSATLEGRYRFDDVDTARTGDARAVNAFLDVEQVRPGSTVEVKQTEDQLLMVRFEHERGHRETQVFELDGPGMAWRGSTLVHEREWTPASAEAVFEALVMQSTVMQRQSTIRRTQAGELVLQTRLREDARFLDVVPQGGDRWSSEVTLAAAGEAQP